MKKIWKTISFLGLGSLSFIPMSMIVSCQNETTEQGFKKSQYREENITLLKRLFNENGVKLTQTQEDNLNKIQKPNDLIELFDQINANNEKIDEAYKNKKPEYQELLNKQRELLSDNILVVFKYLFFFRREFLDYFLLTDNTDSKNGKPFHTANYLHLAIGNVPSSTESSTIRTHVHTIYRTGPIFFDGSFRIDNYTKEAVVDKQNPNQKLLYIISGKTVFMLEIINNRVFLNPVLIDFQNGRINKVKADEVDAFLNKNKNDLTQDDIRMYEERFTIQPGVSYPNLALLFGAK
ncbi:hypothetical protein H9M94_00930 [Mycoplasma sp. Pen4]|uniref:hypothetical protein n=1 Tax=Mycoplasma sp. Pen4 TaxID=640330 RepID=UPI0016546EAC|nr:hypothetical protein [Mycoplasma sp. Pen4]QNM93824.1 hypothetical protein H9M94_00930 [Mycoplasma sp. Pen4]